MAIKKNKDGIMAAITAATQPPNTDGESNNRAQRSLPRGTIGSVRAGLGGIQEIDTDIILPWGPSDRLDAEFTAVNSDEIPSSIDELAVSISEAGQQVPVLLRPAKNHDGRFEVIYGRRRILACKKLGISVKALIRTLDDTAALMAKGLENSSRSDLSYYERARFASAILEQGYDRADACKALTVSKSVLSQFERITRTVPDLLGDQIGSAPDSGRPKWMNLVTAMEDGRLQEEQCFEILDVSNEEMNSDDRLSLLINAASVVKKPTKKSKPKSIKSRSPVEGVQISSAGGKISMSVKSSGKHKAFASWLDGNLDQLLKDAFKDFQSESDESKA